MKEDQQPNADDRKTAKEKPNQRKSLHAGISPNSLSEQFERVFSRMEIAEQEISVAIEGCTDSSLARRLNASFRHLLPTTPLSQVGEEVYRSHVREILERVAADEDLRPGTKAEVLSVLAEASLRSPLTDDAFLLYCKLFRDVVSSTDGTRHRSPLEGQQFHEDEASAILKKSRTKLSSSRGFEI